MYNFTKLSDEHTGPSHREVISVRLQTNRPDGLIWYSGNERDNAHITLKVNIVPPMHFR